MGISHAIAIRERVYFRLVFAAATRQVDERMAHLLVVREDPVACRRAENIGREP